MEATFMSRLEERIESRSLLKHPFYQDWQTGKLTHEDLRAYARQYYFFEAEFPRFLSAIHSNCPEREVRQSILDNLWDEEHGENNHRAMWLAFCRGLGLEEEEVIDSALHPNTQELLDIYTDICNNGSYQLGLAAMYAYEAQVPEVALEKIRGLVDLYGFKKDGSIQFFVEHSTLDEEHSAREAEGIVGYTLSEDEPAVEESMQKALDAWWAFLDGVQELRVENQAAQKVNA